MPWLIEWKDETGNPDYAIREVAATAREAADAIRRILNGYTWTPPEADEIGGPETVPAIDPLVRDCFLGDIESGLATLDTRLGYPCDDGTLFVERLA